MQPLGWTAYTIRSGDTLFAIALAVDSTVAELRDANCIANVNRLAIGQVIFVPRNPLRPVATTAPSVPLESGRSLRPIGCTDFGVQITSPVTLQRLTGIFTVYGTANLAGMQGYSIDVRPDTVTGYQSYVTQRGPIQNGILGQVNAALFGPGLHWLRLTLRGSDRSVSLGADCEIPVLFEN